MGCTVAKRDLEEGPVLTAHVHNVNIMESDNGEVVMGLCMSRGSNKADVWFCMEPETAEWMSELLARVTHKMRNSAEDIADA